MGSNLSDLKQVSAIKDRQVNFCKELGLMLNRSFKIQIRTPQTSYVKLMIIVMSSLLVTVLYYNVIIIIEITTISTISLASRFKISKTETELFSLL